MGYDAAATARDDDDRRTRQSRGMLLSAPVLALLAAIVVRVALPQTASARRRRLRHARAAAPESHLFAHLLERASDASPSGGASVVLLHVCLVGTDAAQLQRRAIECIRTAENPMRLHVIAVHVRPLPTTSDAEDRRLRHDSAASQRTAAPPPDPRTYGRCTLLERHDADPVASLDRMRAVVIRRVLEDEARRRRAGAAATAARRGGRSPGRRQDDRNAEPEVEARDEGEGDSAIVLLHACRPMRGWDAECIAFARRRPRAVLTSVPLSSTCTAVDGGRGVPARFPVVRVRHHGAPPSTRATSDRIVDDGHAPEDATTPLLAAAAIDTVVSSQCFYEARGDREEDGVDLDADEPSLRADWPATCVDGRCIVLPLNALRATQRAARRGQTSWLPWRDMGALERTAALRQAGVEVRVSTAALVAAASRGGVYTHSAAGRIVVTHAMLHRLGDVPELGIVTSRDRWEWMAKYGTAEAARRAMHAVQETRRSAAERRRRRRGDDEDAGLSADGGSDSDGSRD